MAPLPNTSMIPARWQARNARTALGGMQARIRLSHPERLGARNPTSGATTVLPPTVYYEGPARVQVRGQLQPTTGETPARPAVGDYLVAVPVDVGDEPAIGDLVDVLDSPDPLQAGLRLHLVDVPTATQVLQRNLGASVYRPTLKGAPG